MSGVDGAQHAPARPPAGLQRRVSQRCLGGGRWNFLHRVTHRPVYRGNKGDSGARVEGNRRPTGASGTARRDFDAFRGRPLEHILLRHEGIGLEEQAAVAAIHHIEPSRFARLADGRNRVVSLDHIKQDRRTCHVVAPHVVRDFLIEPLYRARVGVQCNERHRIEVVTRPRQIIHLRRGIADTDINQIFLRVDGGGGPGRPPTAICRVWILCKRSAFSADVSFQQRTVGSRLKKLPFPPGSRSGVELPDLLSRIGVECCVEACSLTLARNADYRPERRSRTFGIQMQAVAHARDADDDLAPIHQWRHIRAHAGGPANASVAIRIVGTKLVGLLRRAVEVLHERNIPKRLAAFLIQGDQTSIHRAEEHLTVGHRHASIGGAATHLLRPSFVLITPQFLARPGVERYNVVERQGQVHHTVHHDRRGLEGGRHAAFEGPGGGQTLDVALVDLLEWGETLIAVIPAVSQPVARIQLGFEQPVVVDGPCVAIGVERTTQGQESKR